MLSPVQALVGPDLFLQLQAVRAIAGQLPHNVQRVDVDGETASVGRLLDEARSFAMFSSAKLVVVRSADVLVSQYREAMEKYVEKPGGNSTLVLRFNSLPKNQRIYKLIEKHGAIIDCQPPRDVRSWVLRQAKETHRLALPPEAAALLCELIGNDLGRLDNELAKLALQCDGRVDAESIRGSVAFQREQEMWDMTDELAAGRVASAVKRWRQLVQLDSSAEFRAVTWLTLWLEKVRRYFALKRQGQNEASIVRELKIWPREKERPFLQNSQALGEAGAGRLIVLLADLDRRSKTGLGEMARNVEQFLLMAGPPSIVR
jgi:DNA polymerase III subunit delta